jgi:uncharacterized protein
MAMDIIVIAVVALLASALTLYSGFGLGTLLLPAFALFVPAPVAVAATGVVHLTNNLFKGALLWRRADWPTALRIGLPAVPAAIFGAWLLAQLGDTPRLFEWNAFGRSFGPTGAGLLVGAVLLVFAVLELQPWFQKLSAPRRWMPAGGLATGFFGGLTGQQGALRSIFLLRSGLDAQKFIATGGMIAVLVDVSRIATYARSFSAGLLDPHSREALLAAVGMAAALAGAFVATRFMDKLTIAAVRFAVAGLMIFLGLAMAAGLVG